ncbi:trypco2 family protein [Streptomyces sp. FZ201]|uniref:trypco2 family protein n=1 Tax=Streptomyces sp. FZ201 TaxID=3057122 RepID=UPI0021C230F0|nr:trypco2 family protein [Streptomyces sp. FZ201]
MLHLSPPAVLGLWCLFDRNLLKWGGMGELGLAEAVETIRDELRLAMAGAASDIQFPVGQVTLEFQVGMKKTAEANGKVKVWVLQIGGGGKVEHDAVQKVTIVLDPPVDTHGHPIKVASGSQSKPR